MKITRKILEIHSGGFIHREETERGVMIEPVAEGKDATSFSYDDYIGIAILMGQAQAAGHGVVVKLWQREDEQS